ncbi:MAG: hypothetical protein IPP07_25400 [Holophagales bacterium]|jgi:hypothetical protein|nr:hypothetical protein [Holophagales bacterium]MBK9968023.1 hypothetical protein [Holophagales bacterium]
MTESDAIEDPIEVRVQVVRSAPGRVRVWARDGSGSFVADRGDEQFAQLTAGDSNILKAPSRRAKVVAWPEHTIQMSRPDFEYYRDSEPLPEATAT